MLHSPNQTKESKPDGLKLRIWN